MCLQNRRLLRRLAALENTFLQKDSFGKNVASGVLRDLAMTDGLIGRNATVSKFFLETPVVLQVYALGGNPAAEDGGFSKNYLSGNLCQQE